MYGVWSNIRDESLYLVQDILLDDETVNDGGKYSIASLSDIFSTISRNPN